MGTVPKIFISEETEYKCHTLYYYTTANIIIIVLIINRLLLSLIINIVQLIQYYIPLLSTILGINNKVTFI